MLTQPCDDFIRCRRSARTASESQIIPVARQVAKADTSRDDGRPPRATFVRLRSTRRRGQGVFLARCARTPAVKASPTARFEAHALLRPVREPELPPLTDQNSKKVAGRQINCCFDVGALVWWGESEMTEMWTVVRGTPTRILSLGPFEGGNSVARR